MGYSLLSRFRGTFLGVAIAESKTSKVDRDDRHFNLIAQSAHSLIRCGGLNLSDWQLQCQNEEKPISPSAYCCALLPIALYYHEDESRLAQQLKRAISLWPEIDSRESDLIALGWAIAWAIKQTTEVATNPDIFARLETAKKTAPPVVGQNLEKISSVLAESASLERAMVELNQNNAPDSAAIALGFYCFLSTAENFHISISRAARTQPQPHLTTLLTSALSGAYNGVAGIPLTTKSLSASATEIGQQKIVQLFTVADRLFASWLGLDHLAGDRQKNSVKSQSIAVTAPNLFRHYGGN